MKRFWRARMVGPIRAISPMSGAEILVDYQADAMIGPDLDRELVRLPGTLAWWLALRDTAETAYKEARHHEHNVEEDIYAELRSAPVEKRRLAETEIKMRVKQDARMRSAYKSRMAAGEMLRNLRSAVEALEVKRWSLISLAKYRNMERVIPDSV